MLSSCNFMKKHLLISFILLFTACTAKKFENTDVTTIDIENAENSQQSLSEFADDLELIPLEYTDYTSLVGTMLKMEVSDSDFFILSYDASQKKSIHSFSLSGSFNAKLSDFDQYGLTSRSLKDFAVLDKDTLLVINDEKIFYLDHNFNFIKYEPLQLNVEHILVDEDLIYFHTNRLANNFQDSTLMYDVVVMDRDLNPISKYWEFDLEAYSSVSRSFLSGSYVNTDNGIFYSKFLNDTIYQIDGEELTSPFFVDFGDKGFDSEKFPDAKITANSAILKDGFHWGVINPIVFGDYLYFRFRDSDKLKAVFHSLTSNTTKMFDQKNINFNEELVPFPHHFKDGYFYSIIQENNLDGLLNFRQTPNIKKAIDHLGNNYNPILYKFKIQFND